MSLSDNGYTSLKRFNICAMIIFFVFGNGVIIMFGVFEFHGLSNKEEGSYNESPHIKCALITKVWIEQRGHLPFYVAAYKDDSGELGVVDITGGQYGVLKQGDRIIINKKMILGVNQGCNSK